MTSQLTRPPPSQVATKQLSIKLTWKGILLLLVNHHFKEVTHSGGLGVPWRHLILNLQHNSQMAYGVHSWTTQSPCLIWIWEGNNG